MPNHWQPESAAKHKSVLLLAPSLHKLTLEAPRLRYPTEMLALSASGERRRGARREGGPVRVPGPLLNGEKFIGETVAVAGGLPPFSFARPSQ